MTYTWRPEGTLKIVVVNADSREVALQEVGADNTRTEGKLFQGGTLVYNRHHSHRDLRDDE